jgi:hypothetical protein
LVAPVFEEVTEEQAGRLVVAKLNIDDNPATADSCRVQSIPTDGLFFGGELVKLILGAWPKPAINGRARGVLTMTSHLDRARLADAGRQLTRVDAVLSNTGATRHLEVGLGVAVGHSPLAEPVPPLPVVNCSVTGISGPSTRTELLDEIRVDAGLGTCAVHAVLPGPGGAS